MPSDEYSIIRGGLKLKGSKPTGVTKTRKKKSSSGSKKEKKASDEEKESSLQKALADEDSTSRPKGGGKEGEGITEEELKQLDPADGDGKTASERQMEEMRRRRVCCSRYLSIAQTLI
jgi:protein FAM32A